jgi:hypothetical protein
LYAVVRLALFVALLLAACGGDGAEATRRVPDAGTSSQPREERDSGGAIAPARDPDVIPTFSSQFYLDLAHVERISRFRSGLGHDYADSYEHCRSMKHYVFPLNCPGTSSPRVAGAPAWTELEVRSPIAGSVVRLDVEQTYGTQVVLEPEGYPEFRVKIFHVTPATELAVGGRVVAGQRLGTHASVQTMSDIAVEQYRNDGFQLVSFFETLTDEGFAPMPAHNMYSRRLGSGNPGSR